MALNGKRVLLGLSGGVAAYKAAALTRLLIKAGVDVRVVMTEAATRFIGPVTLQALSGQPVYADPWDARVPDNMGHIELSRDRDLILVAPASADFLAKVAHGLADDLLSTLCAARRAPLFVAPAMNVEMWQNPANLRNVERLRADGVTLLGPDSGDQACGETGSGRLLEPEDILAALEGYFAGTPTTAPGPRAGALAGRKVMVTAGPTFEPIDPVRGITNVSSGKMGYAVAQAAAEAGAEVTLVSGSTALPAPPGVARVDVVTAREMLAAVMKDVSRQDVFIAVAAVADYHVADAKAHKIKRGKGNLTLELAPNPDILGTVAALPAGKRPFCVGFAAETENLREYAQQKRKKKNIPLLAANLAQHAFGRDDNALTLFDEAGEHKIARAPKIEVARQLIRHIAGMLPKASKTTKPKGRK
ncbi:MAG TPA: bifunctional phosphopantothenoylcysteine decarboxylase/phosphopantothenate--cysteine ligase CoaBC [Burkholderiales bacterium]|nr:bifunctional phosphopantothenoylcysteine decarboxylase/phosphopantothenate--cysteine ligase CoaBC [Burkholderiales bacterium]